MFTKPDSFTEFLAENGFLDEIYHALANDDLSEITLTVYKILKKTNHLPTIQKPKKSDIYSARLRKSGYEKAADGKSQMALMFYNEALMHAPINSHTMRLAYTARSSLFYKLKRYEECAKDFKTSMDSITQNIIGEHILNTLINASKTVMNLNCNENANTSKLCTFKFTPHKQISCISNMIDVSYDSDKFKIFAVSDINVGTTVGMEKAYVYDKISLYRQLSCYYCNTFALNLIPCDGCCQALFCNTECRDRCMDEYHETECHIMGIYPELDGAKWSTLALKSVIKMQVASDSWKELIEVSKNMGIDRMKNTPLNEIFNADNKYSVLYARDDKTFKHGHKYNCSLVCALMVHYFESIPFFYPKPKEQRHQARQALARLLMFTQLYCTSEYSFQAVKVISDGLSTQLLQKPSFGFYPFMDKFKKSCSEYNVLPVALNDKLALVTVKPIKSGMEIIMPYWPYGIDFPKDENKQKIKVYLNYREVCTCEVCSKNKKVYLSIPQKKCYNDLRAVLQHDIDMKSMSSIFPKLIRALAILSDNHQSQEYLHVLCRFKKYILLSLGCSNISISCV